MAEAEGIPPTASTASTGLGIRYIGKNHCYAISGSIASDSGNEILMLDFTSGSGYILTKMEFTHRLTTGYRVGFLLRFNEEQVLVFDTDGVPPFNDNHTYHFLIPPFTHVRLNWFNASTTSYNATAFLSGRVYGAA